MESILTQCLTIRRLFALVFLLIVIVLFFNFGTFYLATLNNNGINANQNQRTYSPYHQMQLNSKILQRDFDKIDGKLDPLTDVVLKSSSLRLPCRV